MVVENVCVDEYVRDFSQFIFSPHFA